MDVIIMKDFYKRTMTMDFGMELVNLNKTIACQELVIDELMLKAAKYKADFLGKYDLANKLLNQIEENNDHCVGEFDGFSYSSRRANAVYRTLDDMYRQGLITEEEYRFCEV